MRLHPARARARTPILILTLVALLVLALPGTASAKRAAWTLDWTTPGASASLFDGWTLRTTPALVEVRDASGRVAGTVELVGYPLGDDLAAAEDPKALDGALRARAEEHHEIIAADRKEWLGDGYRYEPGKTYATRFGGAPAIQFSATTTAPDGKVVERNRIYLSVQHGRLWGVAFNGGDPEVFGTELAMLTPEEAAAQARAFDRVVRASRVPAASPIVEEGIVAGVDGGLDGGLLYLIADGGKVRIQQPTPITREQAAAFERAPRTAHVRVTSRATGSRFVVVPPDGPDARLHVIVGDRIAEVVVQATTSDGVAGLPARDPALLNRLLLP